MRACSAAASLMLAILLCGSPAPPARANTIDAHAEVEAVVYASAATEAAFEKSADAKLRQDREQIVLLTAKVRSGEAQRSLLVSAQESLVAQLAEKDRAYAKAIARFKTAVMGLASTPEGAAALARYNSGDRAGALATIHQLNDAQDAALQTATDIQKAVRRRQEAGLALDARAHGAVNTSSVIAVYEEVTRLDPSVQSDWLELDLLYHDAGRFNDSKRAAEMAVRTADGIFGRYRGLSELGDVLAESHDLAGAREAYEEALTIARQLAAADPNASYQLGLSISLSHLGDVLAAQNDLARARQVYAESLDKLLHLTAGDPTNTVLLHDAAVGLDRTGKVLKALGDLAGAREAYEKELTIFRHLAAADPTDVQFQRDVSIGLRNIGGILTLRGDFPSARKAYEESLSIARRLATADPSNGQLQFDLIGSLFEFGNTLEDQDDLAGARDAYAEELVAARRLAKAEPANADVQRILSSSLLLFNKIDVSTTKVGLAGTHTGSPPPK
jgi:tetratricopeptide (TPR) repeat protein